jgi:hypothetical protein
MPLSMALSGLYFAAGVPLPPLLFFLASLIYLSGGLLGGLWGRENLRRKGLSSTDLIGTLFVLTVSMGFLFLGIAFTVIAFQHL